MKKILAFLLSILLVLGQIPSAFAVEPPIPPEPTLGGFAGLDSGSPGNYVISENLEINDTNSVFLNSGTVTINNGVTLTITATGRVELQEMILTNNGTIEILFEHSTNETEPPKEGWLIVVGENADFLNYGQVNGNGRFEIRDKSELKNYGRFSFNGFSEIINATLFNATTSTGISINGTLRFAQGAIINNSGTITAGANGQINLDNPSDAETKLSITGLSFYENADETSALTDPNGQFRYDGSKSKWIRATNEPGPGPGPGGEGNPLLDPYLRDDGNYYIEYIDENADGNLIIDEEDEFRILGKTIYVTTDAAITITSGAKLTVMGMKIVNNGTIIVEPGNETSMQGSIEFLSATQGDIHDYTELENNGTLNIDGEVLFANISKLQNNSDINISGNLVVAEGSSLYNSGSIIGEVNARILLYDPTSRPGHPVEQEYDNLIIDGLELYDNLESTDTILLLDGEFEYNATENKWVRTVYEVAVKVDTEGKGIIKKDGSVIVEDTTIEVYGFTNLQLNIIPNSGYIIREVRTFREEYNLEDDISWMMYYDSEIKEFGVLLSDLNYNIGELWVLYAEEDLDGMLINTFVTLQEDVIADNDYESIKTFLSDRFTNYGYLIPTTDITIGNVTNISGDAIYGSFEFKVNGTSEDIWYTGYIAARADDIFFKLVDDDRNTEIVVAENTFFNNDGSVKMFEDQTMEFEVPALDNGTMEVFGYGNLMAMPFISGVTNEEGKVPLPFNRAQFHIVSNEGVNLYGFYVIQANAFCVEVNAKSGDTEQRTVQSSLGTYADLTAGDYVSEVFFGNDEFILTTPSSGIGGIQDIEIEIGNFGGYEVHQNLDGSYSVVFLSDYYDLITLELNIIPNADKVGNSNPITRNLIIHRTGVNIESYFRSEEDTSPTQTVFHGTQYGTLIDYSDGNNFRVYATYYIPDFEETAPVGGLFVTYTWSDGSITTATISEPCNNPHPSRQGDFINGVFLYGNEVNVCDYLIYSGTDASTAPVKINVTVLRGSLDSSSLFNGIFFGSGAGVEWEKAD